MGPAFNRLWAGSIISNLADGVLIAAAPLLAITLTDSTVLISIIGAMVMLPWLLFAMPIGVMVDRLDRRFILAGSNAIRSARDRNGACDYLLVDIFRLHHWRV